ncbi:GmrSD restriction endonuclease domain-containing protein [Pseudomonas aeruginosa]
MTYRTLPAPILSGMQRAFSISMLWEGRAAEKTSEDEIQLLNLVLPKWQRDTVWTAHQQTQFIEGIFLGLGTGYYVTNGHDYNDGGCLPMSGWLLDGQQRITSIARFIEDALPIFDGIRYSDLSPADRSRYFDNVVFPSVELKYVDDEEVLKTLYRRLNFSGTAHTAADMARLDG